MLRRTSIQGNRPVTSGFAILAAIIMVGILALIASAVLVAALPTYRSSYHAAAWHEARVSADAGIDLGMRAIQASIPDTNAYTWPGWTNQDGSAFVPGSNGIRMTVPDVNLLANSGDGSVRPFVRRVEVDVFTRDDNIVKNPWYRIRSTGVAEVPGSQISLDSRDVFLRRISLQKKEVSRTVEVICRPLYLWEYALKTRGAMALGGGQTWVIDSYDSRYKAKIETADISHRGSVGGAGSDPLDSSRWAPESGGMYDASVAGAFANIASDLERPAGSPYGMLIDAAGAAVRGEVQTNGGDDPTTAVFENVVQYDQIDQTRISSDFDETLLPPASPLPLNPVQNPNMVKPVTTPWGTKNTDPTFPNYTNPTNSAIPNSIASTPLAGTSPSSPLRVLLRPNGNQSQGGFAITPPVGTTPRFLEIYVDGNFSPGMEGVVVPKNVYVKLFVNGNIDFGNRDINYNAANQSTNLSVQVPGNLQIYGVSTSPTATIASAGNGHIVAVFYGPQYISGLNGNTEIIGGIVVGNYNIQGGGGGGGDSVGAGFHYDEALGVVGPIQAYKALSYFEDTRKDLQDPN